ncbi:hypothetical protein ACLOJK_012800 [Asimina triloba]
MEGNPHPGALKGRMSFQSFNPSIDQQQTINHKRLLQALAIKTIRCLIGAQENGLPETKEESTDIARASGHSSSDHKRKHPAAESKQKSPSPFKTVRNANGEASGQSSSDNRKSSVKQPKREKFDWSVLRPPKPSAKRS